MKKILLSQIFLLFTSFAFAQELTYKDTINDSSKSKSDLYLLAREWIAKNFNDANQVIKMDDKDAGIIILKGNSKIRVKGSFNTGVGYDGVCWYTITFHFKDGIWSYVVDGIGDPSDPLSETTKKGLAGKRERPYREACTSKVEEIITEIKTALGSA